MAGLYIEDFNTLLTGEISAVETYNLALQKATHSEVRQTLIQCRDSHEARVVRLTTNVVQLGGEPAKGGGIWGAFAKFVQSSVDNERDAIAVLEEAEAERLVQYEAQTELVPLPVYNVIKEDLLPAQHETHLYLSSLLKSLDTVAK